MYCIIFIFTIHLMEDIRGAIDEGRYSKFKKERLDMLKTYDNKKSL